MTSRFRAGDFVLDPHGMPARIVDVSPDGFTIFPGIGGISVPSVNGLCLPFPDFKTAWQANLHRCVVTFVGYVPTCCRGDRLEEHEVSPRRSRDGAP